MLLRNCFFKVCITHILVFQRLLGSLCLLCDLNVTNNDFEHAHYALPHYGLP